MIKNNNSYLMRFLIVMAMTTCAAQSLVNLDDISFKLVLVEGEDLAVTIGCWRVTGIGESNA